MTKEKSKNQIEIERLEKEIEEIKKQRNLIKKVCPNYKSNPYVRIDEYIEEKQNQLQAIKQADKNARADFKKVVDKWGENIPSFYKKEFKFEELKQKI